MRRDSKLLDTYSDPKFVIQVGNYHGVVLIEYTPDKKYVTDIDLVLSGEDESFIYFFARMRFGESYTTVNSTFSYCDDKTIEVKKNLRAIPFYEVSEKLSSFMPINPEVFIDLVKDTLKEVYAIKDEFMFYQVSDKEIEKYYNQNVEKEELILYDVIKKYFYVCKSIFECLAQKSEKLIIDDYDFHEFPQILLSCFWIRELELYELLISEIPEALTNLHNLRSLSLKLKFLTKLPSSLHRLANLEVLKLERTSISELRC